MPYASEAQKRLMLAAAHGWKKPGGGGPSQAVAEKFVAESQGKVSPGKRVAKLLRRPRGPAF